MLNMWIPNINQTYIFTECRGTQEARQKFYIPEHLHEALGPDEGSVRNVLLLIYEKHQIVQFNIN